MNQSKVLLEQAADEQGNIDLKKEAEETIDVNINIRQDNLQLFKTDSGKMFVRTTDMKENVYIEPIPTPNGVSTNIIIKPTESLTMFEPAKPKEQPDINNLSYIETRMD